MPDPARPAATPPHAARRRVVVAGASGLVGSALVERLRADHVEVHTLVRRPARSAQEHEWLTDERPLDPAVLGGAAAVVSLGGASIGRLPWTPSYRRELLRSRLRPTTTLARAIRALGAEAPVFLSASAVGYYGSQPGVRLNEAAAPGRGFLAGLVGQWEAAARGAGPHARTVLLRTSPIVHPTGVLAPMMRLTRLGLAGPLGRGTQAMPWISLTDEVRAISHLLAGALGAHPTGEADARAGSTHAHEIDGPVNLAGPTRASANDLGFALAIALNRPYLLRAPACALRLALGRDMADGLLLADAHVVPAALQTSGFTFTHATVEEAVRDAVAPEAA